MDAIREDADTDFLTTEIGDTVTSSASHTSSRGCGHGRGQYRGYGGRGHGARGQGLGYIRGRGGRYQPYTPKCTHCRMDNHTTEECGKAPRSNGNSTDKCCYYCGGNGHFRMNCPIRTRAKEVREKASQGQYRKPNNDNSHASIAMASSVNKPYSFE